MRPTRLIFVSVLIILAAYRAYVVFNRKIPENIPEQTKLRLLDELGRLANMVLDLSLYTGVPIAPVARPVVDAVFGLLVGGLGQKYPQVKISDHTISGIDVRVFKPITKRKRNSIEEPTMVYFHGGGWTWLSVDSYSQYLSNLANKSKLMIIAPEYQKNAFPSSYKDCEAIMWEILAGRSGLSVDKNNVIVGGDGSGGNLAAAIAQRFRKRVLMQVLINPALQVLNLHTPSYIENSDILAGITSARREVTHWLTYANLSSSFLQAFLKNAHAMPDIRTQSKYSKFVDYKTYVPRYLNVTSMKDIPRERYMFDVADGIEDLLINTTLAPMMLENLHGVPNAYVVTSQYDVLRDEGIMYTTRLHESDVKVKLCHYPNAFHGFFLFSGEGPFQFQISVDAVQEFADFIRFQLRGVI